MKRLFKLYSTKYTILTMLAAVVSLSSCEKDLENKLRNDTYADTYWKNEREANSALAGTYSLFRKAHVTNQAFFIWGDGPIGIMTSKESTNYTAIYTGGNFVTPYREEGVHNWKNWYRIVDAASAAIENIPNIPDDQFEPGRKSYLLGEAYFLRALAYFYMTRVWGDLPLQTEATTTAGQGVLKGRTSTEEILKFIMTDAQKASSLLTWEGINTEGRRRASKAAALALLAHTTAWENDYAKTILYTDSIINRADYFTLQGRDAIRDVFKDATARENIFVITNKDAENESSAFSQALGTDNNNNCSVGFLTVSADIIRNMPYVVPTYFGETPKLDLLYEVSTNPNDIRRTQFFRSTNTPDVNSLMKYSDVVYKNPASSSDPRTESNMVIFRLADMILLKAEALEATSRPGEALIEMNKVRARAGANPVSSAINLKRTILQERQRELVGEGQSYFDIVRNIRISGNFALVSLLTPWSMDRTRFEQKGYLFPIHNSNINTNRLITQNPYWMGRY
ncbi:RagB/SusD family nutrient uptake outer membrane protein [Sphingobacterium spiritivorum]|uniref:RagB/SusD family nutrient uptake outer membrane protein n=1 Tax=Sphingobacterium spiritivorum TaxID=258 RepID=UPI0019183F3F|nr:RagB/SusD family nutrient uptake outer membrane protein [Sphingobacterium spiritivorum]QQT24550.1 RagB/SusD family nutrient uptake outer membrane protein [Sphingobacterium spiritivorum]